MRNSIYELNRSGRGGKRPNRINRGDTFLKGVTSDERCTSSSPFGVVILNLSKETGVRRNHENSQSGRTSIPKKSGQADTMMGLPRHKDDSHSPENFRMCLAMTNGLGIFLMYFIARSHISNRTIATVLPIAILNLMDLFTYPIL